jgi:hypothetical protein
VTKTGNANLRHVLGEAAHHSRHQPRIGSVLKQRQDGVPKDIVDLSWKAQQRLAPALPPPLRPYRPSQGADRGGSRTGWFCLGPGPADGGAGGLTYSVVAPLAAGQGTILEHPRHDLCANQRATLVGGSSVTDQCHAATALLTREYQVDSSSPILTLTASRATTQGAPAALPPKAPLDNYFHIRSLPRNLMEGEGGAALAQQKGRSGPQDDGVLGPVLEYKWRTMERTRGSENAFVNRRSGVRISPSAPYQAS